MTTPDDMIAVLNVLRDELARTDSVIAGLSADLDGQLDGLEVGTIRTWLYSEQRHQERLAWLLERLGPEARTDQSAGHLHAVPPQEPNP